jgi:hypothetical protein
MSKGVQDVFILAGLVALYGLVLWLYEAKLAEAFGQSLNENPRAIFARDYDRDRMIAKEMREVTDSVSEGGDNADTAAE